VLVEVEVEVVATHLTCPFRRGLQLLILQQAPRQAAVVATISLAAKA